MPRDRVPGDGPRCWCGAQATFSGRCNRHVDENGRLIGPPRTYEEPRSTRVLEHQPEYHRGYLAGLHEVILHKLAEWFRSGSLRTLERDLVLFRGEPRFVCTLTDDGVVTRAMQPTWGDAVANALTAALYVKKFGLAPGVELAPSLETWLAWQDQVRP